MGNSNSPVFITFLWHMHQPIYKKPGDGSYILPWVRLHAAKDYFDMASLIESVPRMQAVINIVPSLFIQLEDYIKGSARDPFLICSQKPVSRLSKEEKLFLLKNFFTVNKERRIDVSARYSQLWNKKNQAGTQLEKLLNNFIPQDYLDLQVLFNLAWCGPSLKKDAEIASLIVKDRNFTQGEKELLLARQHKLICQIVPSYKKLQQEGRIEISFSPFYHPLLPLVCDNHTAEEAQPGVKLPKNRFCHPDDAEEQIRSAVLYCRELFGKEPQGMWPPEGAVSSKVMELAVHQGIRWLATDETILKKSLAIQEGLGREPARSLPAEKLCSPYIYRSPQGQISVFFRNQSLSNLISFVYSSWDEEKASDDFYRRLLAVNNSLKGGRRKHIISIIMDGENAWEYFPNGGEVFLPSLYQKIVSSHQFRPVTFSEFLSLSGEGSQNSLKHIAPGSWIDGNFSTWIGEPAKNEAWDCLSEARETLKEWIDSLSSEGKQQKRETIEKALKNIYIAEGSDWFWWLKKGDQPERERKFSTIHKMHLAEMYRILGLEIPSPLQDAD